MRAIRHLVVHCSATSPFATVEAIQRYWREVMGWRSPGYHIIVKVNGQAVRLAPDEAVTNGVAGHNSTSLHVCYVGGVNGDGVATDTRTPQQKTALMDILGQWKSIHPKSIIQGHRDFAGVVKACPSFDARSEYSGL